MWEYIGLILYIRFNWIETSCFPRFLLSILAKVTSPDTIRFKQLSRIRVLGIFKVRFILVPISTGFFSQNEASAALMEESSVLSSNSFPVASNPETRTGRDRSKRRSPLAYLFASPVGAFFTASCVYCIRFKFSQKIKFLTIALEDDLKDDFSSLSLIERG